MGMDIDKLPSNSNASKQRAQAPAVKPQMQSPDGKKQKVVTGKVTMKKKSEVRKFTEVFVAEDASSVWDHLLHEMVIPMTKNLLVDFGQAFIERMITGSSRGGGSRFNNTGNYTQYGSISTSNTRYANPSPNITRFDYQDIVFTTVNDANAVLDTMEHELRRFGLVRVSDLYDICGQTAPHTAHHYGWTNLSRARVVPVRGGYAIEWPKHAELDY